MKKLFVLLLGLSCIAGFAQAADTGFAADDSDESPDVFHDRIARIVAALEIAHPPAQSFQAPALTPPAKSGGRKAKTLIIYLHNGTELEPCLAAIETFDWEHGKRSDAPQGTKAAGRFAQMLALANTQLGVVGQQMDNEGNLVTTFDKKVSLETAEGIFRQVPRTQGITEQKNDAAGSSTGIYWGLTLEE